ncbi:MAG: AI-2E family transporter [Roseiflexaceae bacterium]|nr:AI-2E family transporter [Roseiflexaceae bacterium]
MTTQHSPSSQPVALLPWWQRVTLWQVALGTALVSIIVLSGLMLIALRYVVIFFFLGIVLATALTPLFDRLRGWGVGRTLAATLVFLAFFAFVGGVIAALVPFFLAQIAIVAVDLPARYLELRETLVGSPSRLLRDLAFVLPVDPFSTLEGDQTGALELFVVTFIPGLLRGVGIGVLVLLLSFYWLSYRALAVQSVALLIPLHIRTEAVEVWNEVEKKIGAFVRGLAILSITIAIFSFVGFSLIGLPYALTIAILAGVLEAVPYVGPIITMAVAGVVGLTVSPEKAILALIVANIVQFIEGSIVVPRAMDKTVGVNPVVTLLALAVFSELFGLVGALLAVPLAAAIQVLLDRYVLRAPAAGQLEIGGRDQLALLRYYTQDLAGDLRQQLRAKDAEATAEADANEESLEIVLEDLDALLASAQK